MAKRKPEVEQPRFKPCGACNSSGYVLGYETRESHPFPLPTLRKCRCLVEFERGG